MVFDKQLIIIGGKGGVGRTTVALALGTTLARHGRRVLVTHARSKQRLANLLGCPHVGEQICAVEENLWAVNMNPTAAIREIGMMVLRFKTLYNAVLENKLVKHFLRAVPALEQYSMLGKAWFHTTEKLADGRPKYDTVIFDGPATGHLINMLRIPQVILDTVPSGPLIRDAEKAQQLLSDARRAMMWIVTLAEEMPVSETLDLHRAATQELGIHVGGIIVNQLYPDDFQRDDILRGDLQRLRGHCSEPQLKQMVRAAQTMCSRRDINNKYMEILDKKLSLPRAELPNLFVDELDRDSLDTLSRRLDRSLIGL
jgi:anion-transporting  ArsA/GET3 family ATPase